MLVKDERQGMKPKRVFSIENSCRCFYPLFMLYSKVLWSGKIQVLLKDELKVKGKNVFCGMRI
jgi:hypothetical protein